MKYEKLYNFENLYKAHKAARAGKRDTKEVIDFEVNLSENLINLSKALKNKTYTMSGYYSFYVHDPKTRKIHALHYVDRVVQHCLCDEILAPEIDKRLIYDNSACRLNKGTHFALRRVSGFLHDFYNKNGIEGYFLRCDIRKFFDSIDHAVLKQLLRRLDFDEDIFSLLDMIIDSFEVTAGKGLPMGNQTSQWFAVYYLDGFDRMIKEKFHIAYYSRYMDDCVIIHKDKDYLKKCRTLLSDYIKMELKLEFNEKTQVFPLKNGVDYLGFHIYITDTGKIIRKVKQQTKKRFKKKLKYMQYAFAENKMELENIKQVIVSYHAHMDFGHTYLLQNKLMKNFVLQIHN